MVDPLPIDPFLPLVVSALAERGAAVVVAEPGAGKTTRLPPAIADGVRGAVWVLEPRRLAARMAAERVAAERGERLGGAIGYQVRFDERASSRTRVRFVTEGVLTRRLARGDALEGVAAVVLDEVHERHVETDLALSLLHALRRDRRPDLRLVAMSATVEAEPLADLLEAPVIEVPGRLHPVTIEHGLRRDDRPLEDQVLDAVARLVEEGLTGHVLVFLPGWGEIRRSERALGGLARRHGLALRPLHGRLEKRATAAALAPSSQRKVILATNVAESSLTIDGVEAVVDSGLARQAIADPTTGLPALVTRPISKASATQRAHRAGRQGPGRCLRLYTKNDHGRRPARDLPELLRTDLTGALLLLRGAGVVDPRELRWLDAPSDAAWAAADALLRDLGACGAGGVLTEVGRRLLRYPVAPRLARVVDEGAARGVGRDAAAVAALLSERPLRRAETRGRPTEHEARSDLLVELDLLAEAERARWSEHRLRAMDVDAGAARAIDRARRQLVQRLPRGAPSRGDDEALLQAILAGHPDRVARRQASGDYALAGGGSVRLAPDSAVRGAEWLVVLDAGGQRPGRPDGKAAARRVSAIEPEWLLDLFSDALEEVHELRWDPKRERVEASWQLKFGNLVVETSDEPGDPEAVAAALAKAARDAGPRAFCDPDALTDLLHRATFARECDPNLPALGPDDVDAVLEELCADRRSFAELRQADLLAHLRLRLGPDGDRVLARLAPREVVLAGGRRCKVTYEANQPPWIASRLQDFFGMTEGPTVGGGRVPLVLHLEAPNRQSVSVTSDLASFWERHYPAEMKALRRRYPKHAWPEDPRTAKAPRPGRVR